ncbi:hypothetical protein AMTR_s00001p00272670 [Amborella trichopoda]|uniref:Uncharacterized protein n=1 Tax=Amborella trichopoda TaxID=13333 RepID=W1NMZ7_AMBTC|nr:hypothetical protein AMTR_s00001p00272670 [Amborella trichopoda]
MKQGGSHSDMLVRFSLSLFTMEKLVMVAKPVTRRTLSSVYVLRMEKIPMKLGDNPNPLFPSWDSCPSSGVRVDGKQVWGPNPMTGVIGEIEGYADLTIPGSEKVLLELASNRILYPLDDSYQLELDEDPEPDFIHDLIDDRSLVEKKGFFSGVFTVSRLGSKVEGGGKRRVFAIDNHFNQSLLRAPRDWCMRVLKEIPMDGTFDQEAPLCFICGKVLHSFELKSTTDYR